MAHETVDAATVKDWIAKGERVVLLDAAHPDAWVHDPAEGGTRHLAPEQVAPSKSLLRGGKVVIFTSSDAAPPHLYATTLVQQGYPGARVLDGGTAAWKSLDLHAASGTVFPSRW